MLSTISKNIGGPLTRKKAVSCMLMNLLAAPGLGSLIAGRVIAGAFQLLFSVAGFVLVILWFLQLMAYFYGLIDMSSTTEFTGNKTGLAGLLFFAFAWCWSLVTSCFLFYKTRPKPLAPPPLNQRG